MEALRIEIGPRGVCTSTVCPGWIRTPMTEPLNLKDSAMLDVDDAARRVVRAIRARYARLTKRQRQVMALIVEGRLNKQIAAQLGLSENTIKVHRHRIMDRMAASSVVELARMLERLA